MRKIKSLPKDLRPREKLIKHGVAALSFEELLSVIFVTGTKQSSVVLISRKVTRLLKENKNLNKESLLFLGIGISKTAQVLACLEIGERIKSQNKTINAVSASQIFALSQEILSENKESLLCFYINARGEILKKEIVAVGTLNNSLVLPREIFGLIKELPIASIILVHNHPSGKLEASEMDIKFTKRVKMAAEILGIKLLDHLIITSKGWKKVKV